MFLLVPSKTEVLTTVTKRLYYHLFVLFGYYNAVKIMQSLGNQAHLRITDIPYIREKHHEISPNVVKRESIGSLSNCSACHTAAENGIYDDDHVIIPK